MTWDGPPLEAWSGCWSPREVATKLEGLAIPWCVVGGWAIDLWLGRITRDHDDLEIAILQPDLPAVRARLSDHAFYAVGDGEVIALNAGDEPPPNKHQTWVCDVAANLWRVDVMIEPDATTWMSRRDPSVRRARAEMIARSADGIPYLRPEGVLLYKAKATRPKDRTDFALAAPTLAPDARTWLREALARVHPGHPWFDALYVEHRSP